MRGSITSFGTQGNMGRPPLHGYPETVHIPRTSSCTSTSDLSPAADHEGHLCMWCCSIDVEISQALQFSVTLLTLPPDTPTLPNLINNPLLSPKHCTLYFGWGFWPHPITILLCTKGHGYRKQGNKKHLLTVTRCGIYRSGERCRRCHCNCYKTCKAHSLNHTSQC